MVKVLPFTFISRNTSRPLNRNDPDDDPEENNTFPFEEEMRPVGEADATTIIAKNASIV